LQPMDEQDRREIFEEFQRVHGTEMARKIMLFVPMVPWNELATKADLEAWGERVEDRFERVEDRFEHVDERFTYLQERFLAELNATGHRLEATFRGELVQAVTTQSRMMILTMLGAVLTFGGLLLAAMRLG
jgi:hypothetical protein